MVYGVKKLESRDQLKYNKKITYISNVFKILDSYAKVEKIYIQQIFNLYPYILTITKKI